MKYLKTCQSVIAQMTPIEKLPFFPTESLHEVN